MHSIYLLTFLYGSCVCPFGSLAAFPPAVQHSHHFTSRQFTENKKPKKPKNVTEQHLSWSAYLSGVELSRFWVQARNLVSWVLSLFFFFFNLWLILALWVQARKWVTWELVLVLGMCLCIMVPIWRLLIGGWGLRSWFWGVWYVAWELLLLFLLGQILKLKRSLQFKRKLDSQTWKLCCKIFINGNSLVSLVVKNQTILAHFLIFSQIFGDCKWDSSCLFLASRSAMCCRYC